MLTVSVAESGAGAVLQARSGSMTDGRKPREDAGIPGPDSTPVEEARGEDVPPRLLELALKLEAALKDRAAALKQRH